MFSTSKVLRRLITPCFRIRADVFNSVNMLSKWNKCLHNNAILNSKKFKENENMYAYSVMKNKGYTISLNSEKDTTKLTKDQFEQIMKENWSKMKPKQLFKIFSILGTYCSEHGLCISDKIFDDFIDALTDNIHHASDEELQSLFYYLATWPETESIRTRNYIEVWTALDHTCLQRLKLWSYDEMLRFITLFHMLNVTRHSDFSHKSINKLATKAKQLTPAQLVQVTYYVGIVRRAPFDMHNLELHFIDCLEELSLDDIAIMSMGFFKSKTPIRNVDLVSNIIEKIVEHSKDIHEVSLAAILKLIRYSVKIRKNDSIYRLLDSLQFEVSRLSVMCLVHVALLGTSTLTLHKNCLTKIAEKIVNCLPDTRIKDLERLVLTFGTFNFIPPIKAEENFFDEIINELRKPERDKEIMLYGRSFSCCVSYLGLLGIYPIDLMDKVLNSEFLSSTYGKQPHGYGREILTIHNTAILFHPEKINNCLSDKEAMILAKRYTDFVPSEDFKKQYNVTERMFLEVYRTLRDERGGSDYVLGDHILPHHQRGDIIICNCHDGQPLPVANKLDSNFGLLKRPPDDKQWIALVIAGRNTMINGTDEPSGPFQAKMRELKALGYHGILVSWSVYNQLKTREELCSYLKDLIKSVC